MTRCRRHSLGVLLAKHTPCNIPADIHPSVQLLSCMYRVFQKQVLLVGRRQQAFEQPVEVAVPVESAVEEELAVAARLGSEEAEEAEHEEAAELVVHLSPGRFHC